MMSFAWLRIKMGKKLYFYFLKQLLVLPWNAPIIMTGFGMRH